MAENVQKNRKKKVLTPHFPEFNHLAHHMLVGHSTCLNRRETNRRGPTDSGTATSPKTKIKEKTSK